MDKTKEHFRLQMFFKVQVCILSPREKFRLRALPHVFCLKVETKQVIFQLNHSFKLQTQREGRGGGLGSRGDDNKAPLSENDVTRRGGNHRKKNHHR